MSYIYTGSQTFADPKPPRTVEEFLGLAQTVTDVVERPLKHKALGIAARCAEKMSDLRAAHATLLDQAQDQLASAGLDYADGKTTALDVLLQAVTLAGATTNATEVRRLAEYATAGINREGIEAMSKLPESWWLAGLKERAAGLIAQANQVADQIGHEPTPQTPGMVRSGHRWAPSADALDSSIEVRHAWEKLEAILGALDRTHSTADYLRNLGCAAIVAGREHAEDYRWLHADHLEGQPAMVREFFLANRHHGEPGLYCAAELTNTPPPRVQVAGIVSDPYTAALLEDRIAEPAK